MFLFLIQLVSLSTTSYDLPERIKANSVEAEPKRTMVRQIDYGI